MSELSAREVELYSLLTYQQTVLEVTLAIACVAQHPEDPANQAQSLREQMERILDKAHFSDRSDAAHYTNNDDDLERMRQEMQRLNAKFFDKVHHRITGY